LPGDNGDRLEVDPLVEAEQRVLLEIANNVNARRNERDVGIQPGNYEEFEMYECIFVYNFF
jgi:hypothetical protein